MLRALILALVLLLIVPVLAADKTTASYRLQPGDEIAVEVSPQKQYSGVGLILPDGSVYLKKVGKMKAAGETLEGLAAAIKKVLDENLNDPEVLVTLTKMAPPPPPPNKEPVKTGKVTIVGAVAKTGPLDLEEGLRVRKALDLAGGATKEADLANITLIHKDLTRTLVDLSTIERVSDPAHNRILEDGDSVEVKSLPLVDKKTPMVRIRGQVQTPGQYELKPSMTLEDLIVGAGKLSPLADVEHVQFQSLGEAVRTLNLVEQQKLGLKGKVFLKEGDEVFVPDQPDRVMVVGAVQNPGPRPVKPGQKLRDFLLDSGDAAAFNPQQIDLGGAQIVRRGEKEPIKVDLKAVMKSADAKDNVALSSGDLLFLPPKREKKKGPLDYLGGLGSIAFLFGLF
jgi:protein involved in polysaccharide export with SLBB domain